MKIKYKRRRYRVRSIFFRHQRADVYCRICLEFELIRDLMPVLVTCKYDEEPIKIKALLCPQHFCYHKSIGLFLTEWSYLAGNRTRPRFYARPRYSGSGVLFVLKRVFVSFPFRFRCVSFLPFLRTFLNKNAFYVSAIP